MPLGAAEDHDLDPDRLADVAGALLPGLRLERLAVDGLSVGLAEEAVVGGECLERAERGHVATRPEQCRRQVEQQLVDEGILLFKYWLAVDQKQQEERFAERAADPLKCWKLSPIDLKAREKYDDYTTAREAMLAATHTSHAPWTLVDFNDQRRGRLTMIRHWLGSLPWEAPEATPLTLPRLKTTPQRERYGVCAPIPDASDDES
ncbi:MAG: hypothetical protein HC777_01990, partial [Hyphomonadaceae bacterium]|nr:hypothetical protein [Hyphomonadaceae bacterium]